MNSNIWKCVFSLCAVTVLAASGQSDEKSPALGADDYYTAHTIWYEQPTKLYSLNYKKGSKIPAGSVVSKIRMTPGRSPKIMFTVDEYEIEFTVLFQGKYHPNMSANEFKDRMLTKIPLEDRTKGMSELDKEGIEKGVIFSGMSKDAVLIAYGYPPEHRTPSTKMPTWIYWPGRFVSKAYTFDKDGILQ